MNTSLLFLILWIGITGPTTTSTFQEKKKLPVCALAHCIGVFHNTDTPFSFYRISITITLTRLINAEPTHCVLILEVYGKLETPLVFIGIKGKRDCHNHVAALPRPPRGGRNRQNQTSANRTNVRKALRLALSSPSEVIAMLKGRKNKITQGKK